LPNRALDDLRVVEYAEMVSGPMCGKLFADMGAEVIKIEPPGRGDEARSHPPYPGNVPHPEKSGFFLYLNTGKKSLTLDPSTPEGAEVFKRLIADADLLIENQRPGYLASIGLGFETLHALNPRLIVTSISPFGQTGPYRDWKGTDLIEWAMSLAGYNTPTLVDDVARENPLRAPGHAAEMMGATNAAAASMMALFHRDATGQGEWVDAPCWQATVNTAKVEMASYSYTNTPFNRVRVKGQVGLEPLPCRDGYVYTIWVADAHWKALNTLLGNQPELANEIYDTALGRQENDDILRAQVRKELAKYDMDFLVAEGQRLGLTIGPVHTVAQAAQNSHLRAREAFVEIDHPVAGRFEFPRSLVQMSRTPPQATRAPLLGEHNLELLGRLGYSSEAVQELRAAGVI
jgi:CoA:oxalate CoA-transferase